MKLPSDSNAIGPYWWWVNIASGNGLVLQATSHYLSQCWPRSLLTYGITRPQWVKGDYFIQRLSFICYPSKCWHTSWLRLVENGQHFAFEIFKCIFSQENQHWNGYEPMHTIWVHTDIRVYQIPVHINDDKLPMILIAMILMRRVRNVIMRRVRYVLDISPDWMTKQHDFCVQKG